eukprot:2188676-Amphidinium_carterae.1
MELPAQAPPVPKLQVYALAQHCRQQGWYCTMLLLLLGFHTLCRTGELFNVRKRDITVQPSSGRGVLFLPTSKSAERTGHLESVTISDSWLGKVLYCHLRSLADSDLLSTVSPAVQRQRLTSALRALSLSPDIRWYSLRRGGATAMYQSGSEFASIAVRGRWANARTVRVYINDGLALLHDMAPTPAQARTLRAQAVSLCPSFGAGWGG